MAGKYIWIRTKRPESSASSILQPGFESQSHLFPNLIDIPIFVILELQKIAKSFLWHVWKQKNSHFCSKFWKNVEKNTPSHICSQPTWLRKGIAHIKKISEKSLEILQSPNSSQITWLHKGNSMSKNICEPTYLAT